MDLHLQTDITLEQLQQELTEAFYGLLSLGLSGAVSNARHITASHGFILRSDDPTLEDVPALAILVTGRKNVEDISEYITKPPNFDVVEVTSPEEKKVEATPEEGAEPEQKDVDEESILPG